MTFFVPHFGQRRCHDIFIVYSDILEVLEKADSDARHLEDKMQKLEGFQWTGKLESARLTLPVAARSIPAIPGFSNFIASFFNSLLVVQKGRDRRDGPGQEAVAYSSGETGELTTPQPPPALAFSRCSHCSHPLRG